MNRKVRLRDGRYVRLRPMAAGDETHVLNIFHHLGPESRYMRFNEPTDALPAARLNEEAADLVGSTLAGGFGLLAFDGEVPVGGARFIHTDSAEAEVAVTVRDDYQGFGLGHALLRSLVREAQRQGIRRFTAWVNADNRTVRRLVSRLPVESDIRGEGGELLIIVNLDQPKRVSNA